MAAHDEYSGLTILSELLDDRCRAILGSSYQDTARRGVRWSLRHLVSDLMRGQQLKHLLSPDSRYQKWLELSDPASNESHRTSDGARTSFDLNRLGDRIARQCQGLEETSINSATLLGKLLQGCDDIFRDGGDLQYLENLRRAGLSANELYVTRPPKDPPRVDEKLGLGDDLTKAAHQGRWPHNPLVGRPGIIQQLIAPLMFGAQTPVLVGEAGVGKTAIVEGLAYLIACRDPALPAQLYDWQIVSIGANELLAGTESRGQLEKAITSLIQIAQANRNLVLFFDEIHALLDTQRRETRTIANSLKVPLRNGTLRCIGATTKIEFDRFIAGDPPLEQRMLRINVGESSTEEAVTIVARARDALAKTGIDVACDSGLLAEIVEMSVDHFPLDALPRKAINLFNNSVQVAMVDALSRRQHQTPLQLSRETVGRVISDHRGIPIEHVLHSTDESRFNNIEQRLRSQVFGQNHVISEVVDRLRSREQGWSDRRLPIARMLLLGPSGIGKKTLAKAIAAEYFGNEKHCTKLNMSMFRGEQGVSAFLGSAPGYEAYRATTTLYSLARTQPFSVVILEGIENAHSVADYLVEILAGSATDRAGQLSDFSSFLFILTSSWVPHDGEEADLLSGATQALGLAPGLADAIDHVALFRPLDRATLLNVLNRMLEDRRRRKLQVPEEFQDPRVQQALVVKSSPTGRSLARHLERWFQEARSGRDMIQWATEILRKSEPGEHQANG